MYLVRPLDAQLTFRQLRVAMAVLVLVLGAGVIYQIFQPAPDCWLGSISAYYYTSARSVVVACLCAIGACLVIYRGGTTRENLLLDIPGYLAFGVAFVPTPLKDLEVAPTDTCAHSNVPTETQLVTALNNNIFALLIGASVMVGVTALLRRPGGRPFSPSLVVAGAIGLVAWILYFADRGALRQHAHIVCAVTLFVGIVLVALIHTGWVPKLDEEAQPPAQPFLVWYRGIVVVMVASFIVIGIIAFTDKFAHTIFWLETTVILLFAVYWVVQTVEQWPAIEAAADRDEGRASTV